MKIALCCPAYGDTKAQFTQSIVDMVTHTLSSRIEVDGQPAQPEIKLFIVSCSLLTESRNRLVVEAIAWDADYMVWLDADHIFPADALLRLLSHNLPVVGCNYARRFEPTAPTASKDDDDGEAGLVWTTLEKANEREVEQVAHMGLGLCMIDMRVFGHLEAKAKEAGKGHFWPLFRIDPTEDGIRFIGEDVYFFKLIREAGIPVYVDHGLSWEVGHIHQRILTNAHACIDKGKWLAWSSRKLDKLKEAAECP